MGCVTRRGGNRSTLRDFMDSVKEGVHLERIDADGVRLKGTLNK